MTTLEQRRKDAVSEYEQKFYDSIHEEGDSYVEMVTPRTSGNASLREGG